MIYNCKQCGKPGEFEPIVVPGFERFNLRPRFCDNCADKQQVELKARELEEKKGELERQWLELCPPLYRQTDENHPDMPKATLRHLLEWRDAGDGMGIGLYGKTGRCKTRMMFALCRKLHTSGVSVFPIGSKRLGRCFSRGFGDDGEADACREAVRKARGARVLFLDDVGKEKFTEHVESEFYDLIEHRTSHLKPTLWTANAVGKELEAMMSADRGTAIIRRLREFSIPIEV